MAPRQKLRTTIIRMAGAAFIRPITKLLSSTSFGFENRRARPKSYPLLGQPILSSRPVKGKCLMAL